MPQGPRQNLPPPPFGRQPSPLVASPQPRPIQSRIATPQPLGPKTIANSKSILQQKPNLTAPPVYRPVTSLPSAPPIYRPHIAAPLQAKPILAAPQIYRPQPPVQRQKLFGATSTPLPPPNAHSRGIPSTISQQFQRVPQPPGPNPRPVAVQRHRNGASPLPARHTPPANVVQKMEDVGASVQKGFWDFALSAATAVGSLIFKNPNPFEMTNFTSCLCLVFNSAGTEHPEDYKKGSARELVFDSIQTNWDSCHAKGTFYDVCPYDSNGSLTPEWGKLMTKDVESNGAVFGERPLIVIVGHSSPGSSVICNDQGKGFSINDVMVAIRPALRKRSTIYLSPCNTGVDSATSPSFQSQFTNEIRKWPVAPDFEYLTIGTTSTSIPAKGKVLTTGQTYSRVKAKGDAITEFGNIDETKFLKRQQK
jgi:hypothetical protein